MKNVLLVSYSFPPAGGIGTHRVVKFAKYLPDHGWNPTVLSVSPRVYDQVDESSLKDISEDIEIIRAFGLDAKQHLSILSRYPRILATPDRWSTWARSSV